jgi:hypothetical protein
MIFQVASTVICGVEEIIDLSSYKEIGISIANPLHSPLLSHIQSPFYIAILDSTIVAVLKKRIHGLTAIPTKNMIIVYCGEVLEDGLTIPIDAFESTTLRSFEEDLFQAKG